MFPPRPAALALAAALVALPVAAKDPLPMSDATKEKVKRATAIVGGKSGHGTGFLVLPNVLATNAHVIGTRPVDELEAKFVDDNGKVKAYPVQLLAVDGARDLALLRVKDEKFAREPLAVRTDLKAGDDSPLGVLGNPGQWGNGWAVVNSLTRAALAKELMQKDGQPFYELAVGDVVESTPAARRIEVEGVEVRARVQADKIKTGPGNSGGPVLDMSGQAVGVLTRVDIEDDTPTGRFLAVPGGDLKGLIDGLGKPDGWDAKGRQAAVRHAHNVALLYMWAEVEAADCTLNARAQLWGVVKSGLSQGRRLATNPYAIDAECMKAFAAACDSLRDSRRSLANAAIRACKGDQSVALKEQLDDLRRLTDKHGNAFGSVRATVTQKNVSKQTFDQSTEELEKYRKVIREEARKAGWDDGDADQLAARALSEAKMPQFSTR